MDLHDAPTLFALIPYARAHRKHPTKSEALLWAQLRGRKLGVRFRQQHPLGGSWIVDFYAASPKLVVEIDGGRHDSPEQRVHDARRQAALEQWCGVRFVRVRAELVERDVLAAVAIIRAAL